MLTILARFEDMSHRVELGPGVRLVLLALNLNYEHVHNLD